MSIECTIAVAGIVALCFVRLVAWYDYWTRQKDYSHLELKGEK